MKSWIKKVLPKPVIRFLVPFYQRIFDTFGTMSYSQEGEDILADRFLWDRFNGFYVDIGAHHPMRFSNTYRFYKRGWRGLNVDATPGSMKLFERFRPRDMNVEAAVSSQQKELTYYLFNEPALNTFDKDLALSRQNDVYSIVKQVRIVTCPLADLLDRYLPANTKIDLLTLDVEGFDYDVLLSNDWGRYTPEFILVEAISAITMEEALSDPISEFLKQQGYSLVAKTMHTLLFKHA